MMIDVPSAEGDDLEKERGEVHHHLKEQGEVH